MFSSVQFSPANIGSYYKPDTMRGDGKTKTENVLSSKNFHMWDRKTTHLSWVSVEHYPASCLRESEAFQK